jgi:hypothetical protein
VVCVQPTAQLAAAFEVLLGNGAALQATPTSGLFVRVFVRIMFQLSSAWSNQCAPGGTPHGNVAMAQPGAMVLTEGQFWKEWRQLI